MTLLLVYLCVGVTLAVEQHPVSRTRSAKFLGFDTDDAFQDLMEEIEDPLPFPTVKLIDREKTKITPKPPVVKYTRSPVRAPEKLAEYNHQTGKFELVGPPTTASPPRLSTTPEPVLVTESVAVYDREEDVKTLRQGGNHKQEVRIFWGSVGDAIENIPFLPIQVNVPDMISAMAAFISNSVPYANQNRPRPNKRPSNTTTPKHRFQPLENRELKDSFLTRNTLPTESNKRIFNRPTRATTVAPDNSLKVWGSLLNPPHENVRFKNMPITRKKYHIKDREVFNFQNSDISNSPIMILNIPSRPITFHKVNHQELANKQKATQPVQNQLMEAALEGRKKNKMKRGTDTSSSKRALATGKKRKTKTKRSKKKKKT